MAKHFDSEIRSTARRERRCVVKAEGVAQSNKACVKVSHGHRLAQDLTVKASTEVTIILQAKLDKVAENK